MKLTQLRIAVLPLLVLLPITLGFAGQPEVVVQIDYDTPQELTILKDSDLRIFFRSSDYLLGTIERAALEQLDRSHVSYRIVDESPWTAPYYFVTKRDAAISKKIEFPPGIIFQRNDKEVVVKISDQEAMALARQGFQIVRLSDVAMPVVTESIQFKPQAAINPQLADLIGELVSEVSDSTYRSYLARLEAFGTRFSFSDSITAVRQWLFDEFTSLGYMDVQFQSFQLQGTIQQNVVVTKPGSFGTDRVIVIGGHYDSVTNGGNPAGDRPGVDDDGSGTAALLEIARVLADKELETTVVLVAFAAEEQGLWGSGFYAFNAFNSGMNIGLMINMDMIAHVGDNVLDFNFLGDNLSTGFAHLAGNLAVQFTDLLPNFGFSPANSDHAPFQSFGFPAIYMQEGDFNPNWHTTSDILANLDMTYAAMAVKSVMATLTTVSNAPSVPANLVAVEVGDGTSQVLQWDPSPEPDVSGYTLYLGSASGSYDEPLSLTETSIILENLTEGKTIYAAVSAIDSDGIESLLSGEIAFTPTNSPIAPLGFETISTESAVELKWQANNVELDFVGYTITRTGPGSSQQQFEIEAPATSYVDQTVQPHILYHYTIQARDQNGNLSPAPIELRGQLATHDRGILIVDGTKDGLDRPLQPLDASVDDFYANILREADIAAQWDVADSAKQSLRISDADMGIFSTVIWHTDVSPTSAPITPDTTALKKYLTNGGKLIITGWSVIDNISDLSVPNKIFNAGQFIYDFLQVSASTSGTGSNRDFIGADAVAAGYPSIEVDPDKVPVFGGNLIAMEVIDSFVDGNQIEVLYTYRSSANPPSANHGRPVAYKHISDNLRLVVIDFPLFFMAGNEARQLIEQVLLDLGESVTAVDDRPDQAASRPQKFALHQSYPNPFQVAQANLNKGRVETTIRYAVPAESIVQIRVYNLIGQVVATLVDARKPIGEHLIRWDGRSEAGIPVQAGVYFYEMRAGDFSQVRKLIIMR